MSVLDKLSAEMRAIVLADVVNTHLSDGTPEVEVLSVEGLLQIADSLDKRGCTAAADRIDELVRKLEKKRSEPGRVYAEQLRLAAKSPPKKYKETGAKNKSDYADPENYKYPIHTEKNVRSALSYFSSSKNYNKYPSGKRSAMWSRIKSAAKKYKIELDPKNDPPWGKK